MMEGYYKPVSEITLGQIEEPDNISHIMIVISDFFRIQSWSV